MAVIIAFSIPGEPGYAQRMRAAVVRGHVRVYQPKNNVISTKIIQDYALEAMQGRKPLEGPLSLEIVAYYLYPHSWSKRARERNGPFKLSRPDATNIAKLAEDSLNSIVWKDDSQVVRILIEKRFDEVARTEIRIELLTVAQPQRVEPTLRAEQGALL